MTSITTAPPSGPAVSPESARRVKSASGGADRVFQLSLRGAGLTVLVIMSTIGLFLFYQGFTALSQAGINFLTTQAWEPDSNNFGIATVLTGTLLIAGVALVLAVPLATGMICSESRMKPHSP